MSGMLSVRVVVLQNWDEVTLELADDTTIAELKSRALSLSRASLGPEQCEVKFRGARVDDSLTLAQAGLVPGAQVIVLASRRQPVR